MEPTRIRSGSETTKRQRDEGRRKKERRNRERSRKRTAKISSRAAILNTPTDYKRADAQLD